MKKLGLKPRNGMYLLLLTSSYDPFGDGESPTWPAVSSVWVLFLVFTISFGAYTVQLCGCSIPPGCFKDALFDALP